MDIKQESKNKLTASTIVLFMSLFYPALNNYIWRVVTIPFHIVGIDLTIATFDAIVWIAVIGGIVVTAKKHLVNKKALISYLIFAGVALVSFMLTSYKYYSSAVLVGLVFGTLTFVLQGAMVRLDRVAHKHLYVMAIITLLISIAYSLYSVDTKDLELEDNMDFAYRVLPSVLIVISWLFTKEKKTLAILLTVIGVAFLILQGTRGPLLCLAIFVCLMLYKRFGMGRFVVFASVVVIAVSLLSSSEAFKMKLLDVSEKIDKTGYSSRFIVMMMEGEITDNNGRDAIKDRLKRDIQESPLELRGLFADREATRGLKDQEYNVIYKKGTYAHNLLLELAYDFGIIIGGLLFLCICIAILWLIKKCDQDSAYIVMLFVCVGFVQLFLSGSYLQSSAFYFVLGLCMAEKQRKVISIKNDKSIPK